MKKLKPAVVLGSIVAIFLAVFLYVRWKNRKDKSDTTSTVNQAGSKDTTTPQAKTNVVYNAGALGSIAAVSAN